MTATASQQESICKDLESHHVHICSLRKEGKTELAECLGSSPTVKCGICGARANTPENVCDPNPLIEPDFLGDAADNQG